LSVGCLSAAKRHTCCLAVCVCPVTSRSSSDPGRLRGAGPGPPPRRATLYYTAIDACSPFSPAVPAPQSPPDVTRESFKSGPSLPRISQPALSRSGQTHCAAPPRLGRSVALATRINAATNKPKLSIDRPLTHHFIRQGTSAARRRSAARLPNHPSSIDFTVPTENPTSRRGDTPSPHPRSTRTCRGAGRGGCADHFSHTWKAESARDRQWLTARRAQTPPIRHPS
jgi:hypothetical protein